MAAPACNSATTAPMVGLVGKKRCGKDTVADYLVRQYGFKKTAYADPIKEAAKVMFCFTDEQLHGDEIKEAEDPRWGISPRRVLQLLGTDIMRKHFMTLAPEVKDTIQSGFWVKRFELWYASWRKEHPNTPLAVSDARFQDEADAIRHLGGVVIRVVRPSPATEAQAPGGKQTHHQALAAAHSTEQVDGITGCTYTVVNDGSLEDLYAKVDGIWTDLQQQQQAQVRQLQEQQEQDAASSTPRKPPSGPSGPLMSDSPSVAPRNSSGEERAGAGARARVSADAAAQAAVPVDIASVAANQLKHAAVTATATADRTASAASGLV